MVKQEDIAPDLEGVIERLENAIQSAKAARTLVALQVSEAQHAVSLLRAMKAERELKVGYYGEAVEGWNKYRRAERELTASRQEAERLRELVSEASAIIYRLEKEHAIEHLMYDGRPVEAWCDKAKQALTHQGE